LETWISHIASNHCRDLLRTSQRRRTDSLDALIDQQESKFTPCFANPMLNTFYTPEDLALLGQVINGLPEDEREISYLGNLKSYPMIKSPLNYNALRRCQRAP